MLISTTAVPSVARPAKGVWDMLNEQFASAEGALLSAAVIAAIAIVLGTAYKTKAIMPTIISAVIGAVLIFLAGGGLEQFSGTVGETVASGHSVVQLGPAHGISVIPDDRV